ncbi:protein takeout-like [Topomyia yanbarensis]|uniref:protein takeout-like n=1 Tax=Topomyia yanbarensis TaxID=2498891 RepID=UPI00273AC965|nr:protein takeout-like [Topomyia yanbarensis]
MKLPAVVLVAILNFAIGLAELGSSLPKVCSRSDPELGKCITEVIHGLRSNLASANIGDGSKVPTLDPYQIKWMHIENNSGFNLKLTNATIDGISGYKVRNLRENLSQNRFDFLLDIPAVLGKGKYDLKMNILFVPVNGKGNFNMTLANIVADMKSKYFLEEKDGKMLVKFSPLETKLRFDKGHFYLENLGQFANNAINANPSLLLDHIKPGIEAHLMNSLTKMANAVVDGAEEHEILLP